MLLSLSLILFCGIIFGKIFKIIKLPPLIGMIIAGIILGPSVLSLLDESLLLISAELRQIALIIILTRAGLNLDFEQLKKSGKTALLICFLPAIFEILATTLIAPMLFSISYLEAALLGSVIAAVSPAVIVPKMLNLMDEGYGKDKGVPQMIMIGASVDDVFVIVLFSVFSSLLLGDNISVSDFFKAPVSITLGILIGIIIGFVFNAIFKKIHMRDTNKIIIILSTAFMLVSLEGMLENYVSFSALLSIMVIGGVLSIKNNVLAPRLSLKLSKLWVGFEVILFTLVGASVNIEYLKYAGIISVFLVLAVSVFRVIGVFISCTGSKFNKKERLFCAVSYLPKATVQAAIGGLPLAMGINNGELILTISVISILVTAPVGAILIDILHKKCLNSQKFTE